MNEIIEGWDDIELFCDCSGHTIRRWMAYYGFPEGDMYRQGVRNQRTWDKKEVLDWLENNRKLRSATRGLINERRVTDPTTDSN